MKCLQRQMDEYKEHDDIKVFINWVVRTLNTDWLTAVVYLSNKAQRGVVYGQYTWLWAVLMQDASQSAWTQLWVYWPYISNPRGTLLLLETGYQHN